MDTKYLDAELVESAGVFPPMLQEITRDNLQAIRDGFDAPGVQDDAAGLLKTTALTIPGKGHDVPIRVYQREGLSANSPAILWMHGGGYIMGSADDARGQRYAQQCACTVVSVDYRIAPEYPFPAGPQDCHDALLWLFANASEFQIDPKRIAIGGVSAGAGMAAGVALMNRDRSGPELAFQFLLYPMLDNLHDTPSGQGDGHVLWTRKTSHNAWEMYLNGTPGRDASPYAAAARATDLSNLPPTYIAVGGQDLFRDECIAYAQRLILANVPTELGVFPGVYHGGESFAPEAKVSLRMQQSILSAFQDGLGI